MHGEFRVVEAGGNFSAIWAVPSVTEIAPTRLNRLHTADSETVGFGDDISTAGNNISTTSCATKRKWVIEKLEEAHTKDIWGYRKWSKGIRNYPTPAITQRDRQPPAVSHKDKCDALRDELFQPPPPLATAFDPDLMNRTADDFEFQDVTPDEVREALWNASTNTAPGDSEVSYKVIRWAWHDASAEIYTLMKRCLRNGYHPRKWRKAIAVALRKPQKPDYSKPRAYHLIQLLECMGKILEKIVARRLSYLAGRHKLIPGTQFGGCANTSTSDVILIFTNDVQAAWNNGKVTSALTFDIKGYFDFVNHQRLLCELRRKHIPLEIVKWVASFLEDRQAAVCIDGIRGEMKQVVNGIPQGSPISPILAAFYSAELLEMFEPKETPVNPMPDQDKRTDIALIMYVDDGMIYVSSTSLDTNVLLLRRAYIRIRDALGRWGLSIDDDKRELQHYTGWKRDKGNPTIRLPNVDGSEATVTVFDSVKWLGVYLDNKLNFNHHVKTLAARAENTVNGLTMLSNTVRGLSQTHLRHLYKACVVPVMTHASAAWWTGKKAHEKEMERVQRHALRLICAAFKTSPINALEIEASVPPIRLAMDGGNRRAAIRFNKLSANSPVIQRLPDTWRKGKAPKTPPPLPVCPPGSRSKANMRKTSQLERLSRLSSPNNERIFPYLTAPWRRTAASFGRRVCITGTMGREKKDAVKEHKTKLRELNSLPEHLLVYSDGSLRPVHRVCRIGAGIVIYHEGAEIFARSIGLGGRAEVYDGELAGLLFGASKAVAMAENDPRIKQIHFFADNTSAIKTIFDPKPRSGQLYAHVFHKKICAFLDGDPERKVEIAWSPGHCDIVGNEQADILAKAGAELAMETGGTRSHALRKAKEKVHKSWVKEWKAAPKTGSFAMANRFPPSMKPTTHFMSLKREVFGRVTPCRIGHCFSGEYYSRFVPSENVNCPCGEEFQTHEHILRTCPRYEDHRHLLKSASRDISLPEILGTKDGIAALAKFLEESGAFTKTGTPRSPQETPSFNDEPDPVESDDESNDGG
ncbi:putative RNA-directed DNA polymerase from transposon BS [Mycena venus]|uniref:Putative RNA-directed DNA polymerase from transposon BS n=1 Tax=Mycena venus TaxID=2733690 RepID=A0A8H6XN65_9AGAR|nr:putative RNA-directed DNA polymerase from transposon BS [Mycena venus]